MNLQLEGNLVRDHVILSQKVRIYCHSAVICWLSEAEMQFIIDSGGIRESLVLMTDY